MSLCALQSSRQGTCPGKHRAKLELNLCRKSQSRSFLPVCFLVHYLVNDKKRMRFCSFCLWYQQGTAITLSVLNMSFWVCLPLLYFKTLAAVFAVGRKQKTVLLQSVKKKVHLWDNVYLVHLK